DFGARADENLAALLQIEDRVARGLAGAVRHERTGRARRDLALPFDEAVEERIEDRRAARVGEDLAAKPDQAARRDVELEAHAPGAVVDHLAHLALAA